jgi:hypothetical protein
MPAGNMVNVEIKGLDKLLKSANPKILAQPMTKFFNKSAERVRDQAKRKAPVDVGRLRSSLAIEVEKKPLPLWAKIGTNVAYAKPVEFGTGLLSDAPDSKHRRYFPPPAALEKWALRHGFQSGYQVARIIWLRGGTKPKRFLRGGMEQSLMAINNFLSTAAKEIGAAWK